MCNERAHTHKRQRENGQRETGKEREKEQERGGGGGGEKSCEQLFAHLCTSARDCAGEREIHKVRPKEKER